MLIEKEKTGGYTATFPDLPGCVTQGETMGELIYMAEDAIETYLSGLKELGEPIPKPKYRAAMVEARPPKKKVG
ncbi:MAG: type II toxin-antitoxin system HicB family antitoxin [SAR324 cluster bacterium]|nr:type II toxin-antitoxin system HicB family antitoxin [SAR324 cluster bacterium]MCZ6629088.1 type II toxin-antitoxin system HicB family antitoxin [SAR324 cluster bacterium]MCZ6647328.1 type II toxin-antitoxin system HicB family antitoxin [SAR324 cluster bacterium]MCZ6842575.1 type II toxin-antitoxin system HicB family antitoxin [SAR324 cluster bacterium]